MGLVARGFERDSAATAKAFGLPEFRFALVNEVLTGLAPERIEEEVEAALDQIIAVLTTDAQPSAERKLPAVKRRAEVIKLTDVDSFSAFEKMNRTFLESEWGDGFPLLPPTPAKVEQMLGGTTRNRDDVVTVLAPGSGLATVEKIAINAVMAGCEPAHLPILIAMCEAYTGLGSRVRALAMSTSAHAPLIVINGPIAKELGINSKGCALGPGLPSRHNVVLGRALRLMMINIGNCRPGLMDMDTIGTARKFSMCLAENEEDSPWEPFHVERGYDAGSSTVTIFATRDEIDVSDLYNWTPEGVLNSLSFYCAIPGGEYLSQEFPGPNPETGPLLLMCPEHAHICATAGWGKKAVREYVYQACRVSARRLMNKYRNDPDKVRPQWKWLLKLSEGELESLSLPVMESANDIDIVVVGGHAGKNLIHRGIARSSTALIKDRA